MHLLHKAVWVLTISSRTNGGVSNYIKQQSSYKDILPRKCQAQDSFLEFTKITDYVLTAVYFQPVTSVPKNSLHNIVKKNKNKL